MKKSLIMIMSFIAIVGMTSSVYAGTYTQSESATNGGGGTITIGAAADPGGALVGELSPGILANIATTATAYGISVVNVKADTNAIGIYVHSNSGALFQKAFTAAPTAADTATAGSLITGYASK